MFTRVHTVGETSFCSITRPPQGCGRVGFRHLPLIERMLEALADRIPNLQVARGSSRPQSRLYYGPSPKKLKLKGASASALGPEAPGAA